MSGVHTTSDVYFDPGGLIAGLLKHWRRIVAVTFIVTGLAFLLVWTATPHYVGEARILIEARETFFTRPGDGINPVADEDRVASQVEVVGSTDILKQVARKLQLSRLPEFDDAANSSLFRRLLVAVGLKADPGEISQDQRVLEAFRKRLTIYRAEKSRVIVIGFSSRDPKLAAEVPNAIVDAYIAVSRDAGSNADSTERLELKISDLTGRVKEAEAKAAAFRSKSDLLIGQNSSSLATQELSELASELSRVRATRATAEANAQSVRAVLDGGHSLEALPNVLSSELVQRLRERQIELKASMADLSTTLLDNHPRMRALRSQLGVLERQIRQEAENIQKGLEAEVKITRLREQQLAAELNTLRVAAAHAGEQEVELRALEREAAAQRELLESYLARHREASMLQERSHLLANARIFSRAVVPIEPHFPKILPVVGATLAGSLIAMVVVLLLSEMFGRRAMHRSAGGAIEPVEQVRMPAQAPLDDPIAAFPPVGKPELPRHPDPMAQAPRPPVLGEISVERAANKLITGGATRAIFLSPEGDEAAASAVLVAREIADAGLRALLLDLTPTGAASRPMLESGAYSGISNLLASEAQFTDVIHIDLYSDCHVIPPGTAAPLHPMRSIDRLPIIMNSLTTAYDVVVVECGVADTETVRRLVSSATEVMVSVLEPASETAILATILEASGCGRPTLVTPTGYAPRFSPIPDRSAA